MTDRKDRRYKVGPVREKVIPAVGVREAAWTDVQLWRRVG